MASTAFLEGVSNLDSDGLDEKSLTTYAYMLWISRITVTWYKEIRTRPKNALKNTLKYPCRVIIFLISRSK